MLPVWDIITRDADDSINTAKIGNILATSCFYSATITSILHRADSVRQIKWRKKNSV